MADDEGREKEELDMGDQGDEDQLSIDASDDRVLRSGVLSWTTSMC